MQAVEYDRKLSTFKNSAPMKALWAPKIHELILKQEADVRAAALGYCREVCGIANNPLEFLNFWIDIEQLRCPHFIHKAVESATNRPEKPDSLEDETPILSYLIFRGKGEATLECTVSKMDIYYYPGVDRLPRFRTARIDSSGEKILHGMIFQSGRQGARCYSIGRIDGASSIRFARLYPQRKRDKRVDLRGLRMGESGGVAFAHLIYAHQLVTTSDDEVEDLMAVSSFASKAFQNFSDNDARNSILSAVESKGLSEGGLKPDLPEGAG